MCSVENCTRTCYKATPCCWNHRGHVSKFTAVVKPVAESVPETIAKPIVEPVVEPAAKLVVESVVIAVTEPAVETVAEAVVKPVVNSVAEAVVEPVVDRNLEYEYNYVYRGRQYEHWIKKHASGVGNVSYSLYGEGKEYLYDVKDAHVLQVVDGKGKNRRFVWLYNHVDRSAFVKFAHEQLKHESHEVFIGNRKIKFIIDSDQKLTNAEFNAYEMTTDELVLQMATDYMAAFKHALEYIDCNFAIYEDAIDFLVTNRSRKMDGGVKLSTHIVTNIGFTVAECKAIVKYMLRESFTQISDVGDSYIEFLKSCIDLQPYRSNGSLSLPGGNKRGNVNQVIKPFNSTFNTPFLLDTAADIAYTDHDLTNDLEINSVDNPQEIFAESSNEFIDKAIQKISKITDYHPSKFDVYGRAPKGNFVYVKRIGSSHCSVCDRIHESDDTMLLIFNEEKQCAWWKCTHAPKETKAIRWYGRGKTEISVDEDAFAPEDIESFAAIAKETVKPQAERKLTEAQRLKLKLIKIVGDKYRRSYGSGAIYERQTDYYYTYKYSDPKLFLNDFLANDESYQLSSKKESDELLHFIKYTVHPGFAFMALDHNYIGFSNGVYDLSIAKFINATDVPKGIQVRKYINQKFEIIETPLFDKYFSFQFTEEEDREFIYFLIGRCLTVLDDKFDFMLMIHGQGGSGKSLLANLIKFAFDQDQIGLLSNSMQEKFGLSEFATKQIVCCDDMPHNIAKTLPRSDFLSMMTRGSISCPVKGKGSIEVLDWNIPTLINSNHMPNYIDEAGEIVRRLMTVEFGKQVPDDEVDVELEQKIKEQEFATFLHRCRSKYIEFKTKYASKKMTAFAPQSFIDRSNEFRETANNSYGFAMGNVAYEERAEISRSEMRRHLLVWMQEKFGLDKLPKEQLKPQEIERAHSKIKYVEMKICTHCGNKHTKDCCKDYECNARSTKRYFINAKILSLIR